MRRAEVGWLRTVLACRPPVTGFCLEACPVPGAPEAGESALRLRAPTSTGPGAGEELAAIGEALNIVIIKVDLMMNLDLTFTTLRRGVYYATRGVYYATRGRIGTQAESLRGAD